MEANLTQEQFDRKVIALLNDVHVVENNSGYIVYHDRTKLANFVTFLDAYRFKIIYILRHLED